MLDVGCGIGLRLAALVQGIGATGRVLGIEQGPPMMTAGRHGRASAQGHGRASAQGACIRPAQGPGCHDATLVLHNIFVKYLTGWHVIRKKRAMERCWEADVRSLPVSEAPPAAPALAPLARLIQKVIHRLGHSGGG